MFSAGRARVGGGGHLCWGGGAHGHPSAPLAHTPRGRGRFRQSHNTFSPRLTFSFPRCASNMGTVTYRTRVACARGGGRAKQPRGGGGGGGSNKSPWIFSIKRGEKHKPNGAGGHFEGGGAKQRSEGGGSNSSGVGGVRGSLFFPLSRSWTPVDERIGWQGFFFSQPILCNLRKQRRTQSGPDAGNPMNVVTMATMVPIISGIGILT